MLATAATKAPFIAAVAVVSKSSLFRATSPLSQLSQSCLIAHGRRPCSKLTRACFAYRAINLSSFRSTSFHNLFAGAAAADMVIRRPTVSDLSLFKQAPARETPRRGLPETVHPQEFWAEQARVVNRANFAWLTKLRRIGAHQQPMERREEISSTSRARTERRKASVLPSAATRENTVEVLDSAEGALIPVESRTVRKTTELAETKITELT